MATTVRLEGLEDILANLEIVTDERLKQSMRKACALVEGEARKKAPKGDGQLRRSITSEVHEDATEIVGIISTPLEYAPYVEYGTGLFAENGGRNEVPWHYKDDKGNWQSTSGMKPQPYMRPALNENREEVKRIIKEGVVNND